MIKLGSVLVLLLIASQKAESQTIVYCYHGSGCRDTELFTTKEECCTSPSDLRTYREPRHEICQECSFTYRCFIDECDDADLDDPDNVTTTFVINNGEKECCSSGQYRSWTDEAVGRYSCNLCPKPISESTTVNDHEPTIPPSIILPKATELTVQRVKTDSESQPQNPSSNKVDQSSGSGRCTAGTVVITTLLAVVTFIH